MRELLDIAKQAAKQAGEFLKNAAKKIEKENGKDIKLYADRESESIILSVLSKTGVPILSEESGKNGELKGTYFVVDPLDGSMNFTKGLKELTCISIAVMKNDVPTAGVVYRYQMEEMFWGMDDYGAFCNDTAIHTSSQRDVAHAVLATGFPVFRDYSEKGLRDFISRVQNFKKIRMLGAAALMGSFVAAGRLDAYMEENIMLWDVAAAAAIVGAAGGAVELLVKEDYQCDCRMFANQYLMKDYDFQAAELARFE